MVKLKTSCQVQPLEPRLHQYNECNKEHIPFLDLNVKLSGNKLSTDLYIKSTDRHQYLYYTSSHPEHTKKSVVDNQALRLSRICSEESDFEKHLKWNHGFHRGDTRESSQKLKLTKLNFGYRTMIEKDVPLVVTYHPYVNPLEKLFMITYIYYHVRCLYPSNK